MQTQWLRLPLARVLSAPRNGFVQHATARCAAQRSLAKAKTYASAGASPPHPSSLNAARLGKEGTAPERSAFGGGAGLTHVARANPPSLARYSGRGRG